VAFIYFIRLIVFVFEFTNYNFEFDSRVFAAFRPAAGKPARPLVRTALSAAVERSKADRCLAAARVCREMARVEADAEPSLRNAWSVASDRRREACPFLLS
jgi:hypothetical protein